VERFAPVWELTGLNYERHDECPSRRSHLESIQSPTDFLLTKPTLVEAGAKTNNEGVTTGDCLSDLVFPQVPQDELSVVEPGIEASVLQNTEDRERRVVDRYYKCPFSSDDNVSSWR
jgi:hypothetical protein